jgi:hypothetical protein
MKFQISLSLLLHHHESKSALTAKCTVLLLYIGQLNGFTGQSIQEGFSGCSAEILVVSESELSDFTANCVKSPCTQENALRTFIQRRSMLKIERQEETAQLISCMYLCTFYYNFSVENG